MNRITTGDNYSGIGPSHFNKRQLLEIIKMRQRAGRKTRRAVSMDSSRTALESEAKRVRTPNSWSSYYMNPKIRQYA